MLKWRFPAIQDEDLQFEEGKKEHMLKKLASKINKTRAELELIFADLQRH